MVEGLISPHLLTLIPLLVILLAVWELFSLLKRLVVSMESIAASLKDRNLKLAEESQQIGNQENQQNRA